MLKINLLPLERRKLERTPFPRLFLIMIEASILTLLAVYVGFNYFVNIPEKNDRIQKLENDLKGLSSGISAYDSKIAQKTEIEQKLKEIQQVVFRDFEWFQINNAIKDVVLNNPKIWLETVKVLDARSSQSELRKILPDTKVIAKMGIQLKCRLAGNDLSAITRFRMQLKNHPVLLKFFDQVDPMIDFKISEEKDYEEGFSISFTVGLFNVGK